MMPLITAYSIYSRVTVTQRLSDSDLKNNTVSHGVDRKSKLSYKTSNGYFSFNELVSMATVNEANRDTKSRVAVRGVCGGSLL